MGLRFESFLRNWATALSRYLWRPKMTKVPVINFQDQSCAKFLQYFRRPRNSFNQGGPQSYERTTISIFITKGNVLMLLPSYTASFIDSLQFSFGLLSLHMVLEQIWIHKRFYQRLPQHESLYVLHRSKISKNWNPTHWVQLYRFFKNWFLPET